ncbi:MAG: hypothetical protein J5601_07100 [Elusimicrobiaceae bacterium]|nr:hypothetical protein [Elusimicrobiaceae bacterium]
MPSTLLHAQRAGRFLRRVSTRHPEIITRVLQRRADISYKKASSEFNKHFTLFAETYPVKENFIDWEKVPFQAQDVYPNNPFLTNNEQANLYLQSKINREIIKRISFNNKLYNQISTRLEDLERAQEKCTPEPQEDVDWLIEQIPQNTSYLLLGEYHGMPKVLSTVNSLVRTLRQQQPERKIFLFTEFLYHTNHPVVNDFYKDMLTDLELDQNLNIPVIGLEMELASSHVKVVGERGMFINITDLWATREGLRIRNNYWFNILKKYRAEYPDALFIVYAGIGHLGYTEAHSISHFLPESKTFVISFMPEMYTTDFDSATKKRFYSERILKFNDPKLSHLAGFDVQLRISDI